MRLPITQASGTPPWAAAKAIALRPGGSCDPDTMAESVSSRWCLARSVTAAGSGRRGAPAI